MKNTNLGLTVDVLFDVSRLQMVLRNDRTTERPRERK